MSDLPEKNNNASSVKDSDQKTKEAVDELPLRDRIVASLDYFGYDVVAEGESEADPPGVGATSGTASKDQRARRGDVVPMAGIKRESSDSAESHADHLSPYPLSWEQASDEKTPGSEQLATPANDEEDSENKGQYEDPLESSAEDDSHVTGFSKKLREVSDSSKVEIRTLAKALSAYEAIRKTKK